VLQEDKVKPKASFQLQPFEGMTGKDGERDSKGHIGDPLSVKESELQNDLNLQVQKIKVKKVISVFN
jgi:hypothetical protein